MSNSEPSTIVLHGIPCIGGLYISFDSKGEIGSLIDLQSRFAAIDPFQITHEVSNWLGIARRLPSG